MSRFTHVLVAIAALAPAGCTSSAPSAPKAPVTESAPTASAAAPATATEPAPVASAPPPAPAPPTPVDPATLPPSAYTLNGKSISAVTIADMVAALKKAGYAKTDKKRQDDVTTGPWQYLSVVFFDKAGGEGRFEIRRPAAKPETPGTSDEQWSPATWEKKVKGRAWDEASMVWVSVGISGDNDSDPNEKSPGKKLFEKMIKQP